MYSDIARRGKWPPAALATVLRKERTALTEKKSSLIDYLEYQSYRGAHL